MKRFFLYSLFIFSSIQAVASYIATPLHQLIERSTWIVSGTIIRVEDETFTISISDKIKGNNIADTLKIRKFFNWTCAFRHAPYKEGQAAIYFLSIDSKTGLPKTLGAANEGELIIDNKKVYVKDSGKLYKGSKIIQSISPYTPYASFDIPTALNGIRLYLENHELIEKELTNKTDGKTVYQYSYTGHLPKNDFLLMAIDEKKLYYRRF
jgi:hypothetical protein